MKKILFTLFLFILISIKSAYAEQSEPASPVAIQCKTKQTCDRNPEHLEKFVKEFFEWYIHYNELFFTKDKKLISSYKKQKEDIIKNLISDTFYQYRKNLHPYESDFNPLYCPTDTDIFLCTQDYEKKWFSNAIYKTIKLTDDTALIHANISPDYNLNINLKVINGIWKIDRISNND